MSTPAFKRPKFIQVRSFAGVWFSIILFLFQNNKASAHRAKSFYERNSVTKIFTDSIENCVRTKNISRKEIFVSLWAHWTVSRRILDVIGYNTIRKHWNERDEIVRSTEDESWERFKSRLRQTVDLNLYHWKSFSFACRLLFISFTKKIQ